MSKRSRTKPSEDLFIVGARVKNVKTNLNDEVTNIREGVIISKIGTSISIQWDGSSKAETWDKTKGLSIIDQPLHDDPSLVNQVEKSPSRKRGRLNVKSDKSDKIDKIDKIDKNDKNDKNEVDILEVGMLIIYNDRVLSNHYVITYIEKIDGPKSSSSIDTAVILTGNGYPLHLNDLIYVIPPTLYTPLVDLSKEFCFVWEEYQNLMYHPDGKVKSPNKFIRSFKLIDGNLRALKGLKFCSDNKLYAARNEWKKKNGLFEESDDEDLDIDILFPANKTIKSKAKSTSKADEPATTVTNTAPLGNVFLPTLITRTGGNKNDRDNVDNDDNAVDNDDIAVDNDDNAGHNDDNAGHNDENTIDNDGNVGHNDGNAGDNSNEILPIDKEFVPKLLTDVFIANNNFTIACANHKNSFTGQFDNLEIKQEFVKELVEKIKNTDVRKQFLMPSESGDSDMTTDTREFYDCTYFPSSSEQAGCLFICYSADQFWLLDVDTSLYKRLLNEKVATISKAIVIATSSAESKLYTMLKCPSSCGNVNVSSVVDFLTDLKRLSFMINDLRRASASSNLFCSKNYLSNDSRLVNGFDTKLIRGFYLSDAIAVEGYTAKGNQRVFYQRAIIVNTYVKVEGFNEELVLIQIAKTVCTRSLLLIFVYKVREKEILELSITKTSDVTCNFEKKVPPDLIAEAYGCFVKEMQLQKRFYARKDSIPFSFKGSYSGSLKDAALIRKMKEVIIPVTIFLLLVIVIIFYHRLG